ncbi:sigma-70 family RNA polymerase sigma factor [Vagococcus salmoninarum]|uniref:sigma-70 family RNA polymerase sigma factor n=1 Tax=Vagococcus salmoninarum TaxID=2739 RepID=UPI003F9E0BAB
MTEEERLFLAAKNGESEAFRNLYQQYQPVVFKIQQKFFLKDLDQDDWHQEARIVFFLSLQRFDKDRGITIGSFFRINLERHIVSLLRKQGATKRQGTLMSTSLEQRIIESGEDCLNHEGEQRNLFIQYIMIRETLKEFSDLLSFFENEILELYLKGQTISEIAEIKCCSINKVKNGLSRIRVKFKKEFRKIKDY